MFNRMIHRIFRPFWRWVFHRAHFEATLLENNLRDPAITFSVPCAAMLSKRHRRWMRVYRLSSDWLHHRHYTR